MSDIFDQPVRQRITLSNLYPDEALKKANKLRDLGSALFKSADQSSAWRSLNLDEQLAFGLKVVNLPKSDKETLVQLVNIGKLAPTYDGEDTSYKGSLLRNVSPKVDWINEFVNAPDNERHLVFSKIAKEAADMAVENFVDFKKAGDMLSIGFAASYFGGVGVGAVLLGPAAATALVGYAAGCGIAHYAAKRVLDYGTDKAFELVAEHLDKTGLSDSAKSATQFGLIITKLATSEYGPNGLDSMYEMAGAEKSAGMAVALKSMLKNHGLEKLSGVAEGGAQFLEHVNKETIEKLSKGVPLNAEELEKLEEVGKEYGKKMFDGLKDEGESMMKSLYKASGRASRMQRDSALLAHANYPANSPLSKEALSQYAASSKDDPASKEKLDRLVSRMSFVKDKAESNSEKVEKAELYLTLGMDDKAFDSYRKAGTIKKSAMLLSNVPEPGESRAASAAVAVESFGTKVGLKIKMGLVVKAAQIYAGGKTLATVGITKAATFASNDIRQTLKDVDKLGRHVGHETTLASSYDVGLTKLKSMLDASRMKKGLAAMVETVSHKSTAP